MVSVATTP